MGSTVFLIPSDVIKSSGIINPVDPLASAYNLYILYTYYICIKNYNIYIIYKQVYIYTISGPKRPIHFLLKLRQILQSLSMFALNFWDFGIKKSCNHRSPYVGPKRPSDFSDLST